MPDVPLYVAAITAAAGVGGAAIPAIAVLIRDVRQAERDRNERLAEARRQACLDLLRVVGELRTRVANASDYHGTEMGARLAAIRESEAAVQLHAVRVAVLTPGQLTKPAAQLAEAASRLIAATEHDTDVEHGVMPGTPDFTELDEQITAFRLIVVADAGA